MIGGCGCLGMDHYIFEGVCEIPAYQKLLEKNLQGDAWEKNMQVPSTVQILYLS